MKIVLHLHPERLKVELVLFKLVNFLRSKGHQIYINSKDNTVFSDINLPKIQDARDYDGTDLVISIGGDGTFIGASRNLVGTDIPILGLHLGGLGFLAEVLVENFQEKLREFFAGKYRTETRKILEAEVHFQKHEEKHYAINDFLIHRSETMGMCTIDTYVDDDYLNTYRGDGLIISTPSGSTAYNMSAGGPIVLPHLDIMTLTPVCPHSLSARPLIIGNNQLVTFNLESNHKKIDLDIDGQFKISLARVKKINIKISDKSLKVIRFKDYSFFRTLQTKLNWGVDKRNHKD
ncbi:MAG: NAD(+)/NADH kinase [Candidatus Marinimicrobia bacterium]|nr:NAD(+)/NADH kinase [Candidatus Neomarinimicrobiota bacterium]